jgi:carboxymethylenebutenolidase
MPPTTIPGATTAPELDGYLAVPPVGEGPWPGVVVVHEVFGRGDDTRQQADRLAAAGYLAVVPDLYTAGGALRCVRGTVASVVRAEGPAFGDLEAARTYLAGRPDCTGRVGVIGCCAEPARSWAATARGTAACPVPPRRSSRCSPNSASSTT